MGPLAFTCRVPRWHMCEQLTAGINTIVWHVQTGRPIHPHLQLTVPPYQTVGLLSICSCASPG